MGAANSGEIKREDVLSLVSETHFTEEEILQLWGSFKEIATKETDDGEIDVNEFATMLGIKNILFAEKIFKAFDSNPDFKLDFIEFAKGISECSARASLEEKARFVFRVYDADDSGEISKDELLEVMSLSLKENANVVIPEETLNKIIDKTIKAMDTDGNGEISIDEFIREAKKNPNILNCVAVDINKIFNSK